MSGDATRRPAGGSSSRLENGARRAERRAKPATGASGRSAPARGPRVRTLSRGHMRTFRSLSGAIASCPPPRLARPVVTGDSSVPALASAGPLPHSQAADPWLRRVIVLINPRPRGPSLRSRSCSFPLPRSPPAPWPHRPCRFSRPRCRRRSNDFFLPGTQPNELNQPIFESSSCVVCHANYDPDHEPTNSGPPR